MRPFLPTLAAFVALSIPAGAAPLSPALAGLGFLVGHWTGGGKVGDSGGSATGHSSFSVEVDGAVLLRRDHTDLRSAAGAPAGGFDQIMMIFPEANTIRADYEDGTHLIHYTSASVQPGRSVTFTSAASPGAPVFTLAYTLITPHTLSVAFAMRPPGAPAPIPIATGTLTRDRVR